MPPNPNKGKEIPWKTSDGGEVFGIRIPKGERYKQWETTNFGWLWLETPIKGKKFYKF